MLEKQAEDEAVTLALEFSKHPAPPKPMFEFEETEFGSEFKVYDDLSSKYKSEGTLEGFEESEEEVTSLLSDAEAEKTCLEWKSKYSVSPGVSWGDLPFDLQQKWLEYSCDYFLLEN